MVTPGPERHWGRLGDEAAFAEYVEVGLISVDSFGRGYRWEGYRSLLEGFDRNNNKHAHANSFYTLVRCAIPRLAFEMVSFDVTCKLTCFEAV